MITYDQMLATSSIFKLFDMSMKRTKVHDQPTLQQYSATSLVLEDISSKDSSYQPKHHHESVTSLASVKCLEYVRFFGESH